MVIPECPRQICINYAKQGAYKSILDYLITCDFKVIRFRSTKRLYQEYSEYNIWCSNANKTNDAFDCAWRLPSKMYELTDAMKLPREMVEKHLQIHVTSDKAKTYLSCFSVYKNIYNLKMWNDYADSNRGVCFVYDISKIAYILKCLFIWNKSFGTRYYDIAPISYTDNHGSTDHNSLEEDWYSIFYSKATEWKDEEEWRVMTRLTDEISGVNWYCKPDEIIIGHAATDDTIKTVKNKCRNISIKQAKINYYNNKLQFEDVNI